jgi:hypothetical protein
MKAARFEIKQSGVRIELTEHEARLLLAICDNVGGTDEEGHPRHVLSSIGSALRLAGVSADIRPLMFSLRDIKAQLAMTGGDINRSFYVELQRS